MRSAQQLAAQDVHPAQPRLLARLNIIGDLCAFRRSLREITPPPTGASPGPFLRSSDRSGMRSALMLATLLGIGLLAACGKKGPPSPPGPPEQITYPRAYPTY
jgi:hypothetical protein